MEKNKNFKILIVDDSSFSRTLLGNIVQNIGHQVVGSVGSGKEALDFLANNEVDIVVTDIVMPEMTGIELTGKISKKYNDIHTIVVSSLSQEHVILEAIGAGAMDFIPKPVSEEQMKDSIDKIIKIDNND
jgi:two-component system chemotaxis response regulator CheY